MAQNVIFLPAWVSWPPPRMPTVLGEARTLLYCSFDGFIKLAPWPIALTGAQAAAKEQHAAAAAIVCNHHGQGRRPHFESMAC